MDHSEVIKPEDFIATDTYEDYQKISETLSNQMTTEWLGHRYLCSSSETIYDEILNDNNEDNTPSLQPNSLWADIDLPIHEE